MTDTKTRLSATLEAAPESISRWAVTKCRKFRSIEGQGFEATVTLDGTVVGTLANEGTGGGTWFRQSTREAMEAFEVLCAEWATANPPLAMPTSTVTVMADGSKSQSEAVPMVHPEHICDSLVENFEMAKRLDGYVKRGKTPCLTPEQADEADNGGEWKVEYGIKGFGAINGPLTDPGVRAAIAKNGVTLVWHDGAWRDPSTV